MDLKNNKKQQKVLDTALCTDINDDQVCVCSRYCSSDDQRWCWWSRRCIQAISGFHDHCWCDSSSTQWAEHILTLTSAAMLSNWHDSTFIQSRIRAAFFAVSPTSYFHSIYNFLFFCSSNDEISNTFRIHQFTCLIWLNCLSAKQEESTLQKTVRSESTCCWRFSKLMFSQQIHL